MSPHRASLSTLLCYVLGATLFAVASVRGGEVGSPHGGGSTIQRIVSLAPHITELLFAAGAGDKVVAVVDYSDYPPDARKLPSVGDAARLDLERIIALGPDLVIAWNTGTSQEDVARLRHLGINVHVSNLHTMEDIAGELRELGRLAGTETTAETAAEAFEQRLAGLRSIYRDRETVSVFVQVWERPLMTVGGRHIISDALRICGGRNPFANLRSVAPTVSVEAVLKADPQVIVGDIPVAELSEQWSRWPDLTAVRRGHIYTVPAELIARPTPRMLDGVERLCAVLDEVRANGVRPAVNVRSETRR